MTHDRIQELLNRYWDGETSLEEEREIKAYFSSGQIAERFKPLAPLFAAIREEQGIQLTTKAKAAGLRPQTYFLAAASVALLIAAAWWIFHPEQAAMPVAVEQPVKASPAPVPVESINPSPSIAMSAPKSGGASSKIQKTPRKSRQKPAEIDPETARAMAEIKAALALVSSKLDKGRHQAVKGATHLEALDKVPKRKDG